MSAGMNGMRLYVAAPVYIDARQEPNIEERFIRAEIAADRTNDDSQIMCGFYELD